MSTGTHLEIERKYLIRFPDLSLLRAQSGCEVWDIEQVYLTDGEGGQTRRVRRVACNGEIRCYRTFKRRITDLCCAEDEGEIAPETYAALLREADRSRSPIVKTRHRFPHGSRTVEIDIYPFWNDRAIMEIELESEDEAVHIPDFIEIIRDVSGEKAYRNRQLARRVPMEEV